MGQMVKLAMNNEVDFKLYSYKKWTESKNSENEEHISEWDRLKKALPIILEEACSEKQRLYIVEYFVNGKNINEIAKTYGVCKSTVSRQIHKGLSNMHGYLRCISPYFANISLNSKRLSNRKNRGFCDR